MLDALSKPVFSREAEKAPPMVTLRAADYVALLVQASVTDRTRWSHHYRADKDRPAVVADLPAEEASVTLTILDDLAQSAAQVAKTTGVSSEMLLLQALPAHFPPLSPELQWEFDAWERASDKDMGHLDAEEGLSW